MKLTFYIIFTFLLFSCSDKKVAMPILSNSTGIFNMQQDSLVFISTEKKWEAVLLSFTQPISLQINYTKKGFIISPQKRTGLIEGKAQLVLKHNDHFFYYDLILKNSSAGLTDEKDYRSPKTVNPDSSLQQQSIVHRLDQWRNLLPLQKSAYYFRESQISLSPKSGIYRAQKTNAVSAYYVQPGSVISIPLEADYDPKEKRFIVSAGPLKDVYKNLIANGTMAKFKLRDNTGFFIREVAVLNGFATTTMHAEKGKNYTLSVSIHTLVSPTIELHPK